MRYARSTFLSVLSAAALAAAVPSHAQQATGPPATLEVSPERLELGVGESVQIEAVVRDDAGRHIDGAPLLYLPVWGQFWNLEQATWGFNLFRINSDGLVTASKPGDYAVIVRVPREGEEDFLQLEIPLHIRRPDISAVELVDTPRRFYAGTRLRLNTRYLDPTGTVRDDVAGGFRSSDSEIATIDRHGNLTLHRGGTVTLTAMAGTAHASLEARVENNPADSIALDPVPEPVRTGDVLHLVARVLDDDGRPVTDAPVELSFHAEVDPRVVGGPVSGMITQDGRFVADLPGTYTVIASSGGLSNRVTIEVEPRQVRRQIELVGHGRVKDRGTSDLWIWEGADGRDYAITGTHSAEGHAYIWDVTDPAKMVVVDTIHVDARTVNDVKVSEDGRVAVISREGASSRRNGIVILDVAAPRDGVRVLARYDDELTGGVHNLFIHDQHVYALSAGQRYDIISIEDPTNPRRVGRFALPNHDRSIHDIWVLDGIAYSSNWNHGVVMVDVGGGDGGGSPRQPVMMAQMPFPTGWNHAVHPYRSKSTGKHYVFAGDEAARTGRFSPEPQIGSGTPGYDGDPERWRGWVHILEWEPGSGNQPRPVARFAVPEAGSHNIWVEDDIMYVAFYNGGLRVVDVSGDLMGDLYRQGREIAHFLPFDPEGFKPNAPQVWGAQPYKGHVFFSDYNSGLWAVRLVEEPAEAAGDSPQSQNESTTLASPRS